MHNAAYNTVLLVHAEALVQSLTGLLLSVLGAHTLHNRRR
jgi:hypothetical protein